MNNKLVKLLSILPFTPSIRGRIYKLLFWGRVGKGFKIGVGSYIDAATIQIGDNVDVGNMVRIKFLDSFQIGDNSSIGSNTIICGAHEKNKFQERQFICGNNVGILCSHYFDVVAPIIIGNDVTIAGKWTQFYTHSFDLEPNRLDGGITIGNHVYIGASSLINLGVTICDNVVIQGGSCVNKSISESGVYASQSLYKRGNVRNYSDLYGNCAHKTLDKKIKVFSVRDK